MVKLDEKVLEKALSEENNSEKKEQPKIEMTKEEEIGFHKGALNTLASERNELVKMIQNVETIMQMHLKRLEGLGVKIDLQKGG